MRSIPHSPHFIKTLIKHPLLGSFFIKELLINCCCNIQEILNQAHSYTFMTQHSPNNTMDLSSPCCSLSWAEPSIMNVDIISSALSHTSASSQVNFILLTSLVSSLSSLCPPLLILMILIMNRFQI